MLEMIRNLLANDTSISELTSAVGATSATSTTDMLVALLVGVLMGFLISAVYVFTHRKSGYTQSYVLTLLLLPPIVATVLVMVNSMASALSLAGVFTLCRYRTIPGDPKDITYVFFSMSMGVLCGINGAGHLWFVFVFFAVVAAVLILVEIFGYGHAKNATMNLKITIPENLNYMGLFDDVMNRYTDGWHLKKVKTVDFGSLFELVYTVHLSKNVNQKQFIDDIRKLNGNLTVILSIYHIENEIL